MLLKCNAKINLGLSILNKRDDGFHNLESIFIPVPWYDEVELTKSSKLAFSSEGIKIDGESTSNLCLKAYDLLAKDFDLSPVNIHLTKRIPIGAGLGGGSSDAAFVLKGLNELLELGLTSSDLERYADQLGSDCSFFIQNKLAFVSGKGEVLNYEVPLNLEAYCILINPGIHISTKEAYSKITPRIPDVRLIEAISFSPEKWGSLISNDFEKALIPTYPKLKKLQEQLYEMGAFYVSMSGSGSSFYAFFREKPKELRFDKAYDWKQFIINTSQQGI